LSVNGIGPETADSILLYAAGLPVFVVDAYTRRIFTRLGWLRGDETYDDVQRVFMDRLPPDAALYNDYHAQIVRLGKDVCRTRPRCDECPLEDRCAKRGVRDWRAEAS
jgi:endonuclease-3 related protein